MEENNIKVIKGSGQTEIQDLALNHKISLGEAVSGIHRHVSLRYGVEFQSKVALYAKERASCQSEIAFESMPKERLFKKVIAFIEKAYTDPNHLKTLLTSFKELNQEMKLQVHKSRQSILSQSSEQSCGSSGASSSSANNNHLVQLSKSSSPPKENGGSLPKLKKTKTSVMSKANRISLADAINVTELQRLKVSPIETIPSSESCQSQSQESLNEFNSRGDLKSDSSETVSNKNQSMTSLNKVLKQEKNKKISIMLADDFNSGSDIFSEEDIVSLTDLKVPEIILSSDLLQIYFDFFSPFLVNLAVCLFFKCLAKSHVILSKENASWLLGIATVVAYKVYYDEPIDGLMQFFGQTLSMTLSDIIKLQRWFLYSVDYELVVSTQQYQHMMFQVFSQKEDPMMI